MVSDRLKWSLKETGKISVFFVPIYLVIAALIVVYPEASLNWLLGLTDPQAFLLLLLVTTPLFGALYKNFRKDRVFFPRSSPLK
jgi:hypothetical protein